MRSCPSEFSRRYLLSGSEVAHKKTLASYDARHRYMKFCKLMTEVVAEEEGKALPDARGCTGIWSTERSVASDLRLSAAVW